MEDAAPPPAETPAAAPAGGGAGARVLGPGGRYQILSLLGRGGFGAVYRARDTVLDGVVHRAIA